MISRIASFFALALLLSAGRGVAATIYFAQTSAGGNTGADCADAIALSAVTWTAGNTYEVCGTITSQIAPSTSGSSGNPITIQFQPNAQISMASCGATGCIDLAARSYIIIDGGTNGVIQATNVGTGLGGSQPDIGIYGRSGMSHCEIKNLTVHSLYVLTSISDGNANEEDDGVWMNGSDNLIHNNTFYEDYAGVKVESTSSGNQFYENTIHDCNWGIYESGGGVTNGITDEEIYGNDVSNFASWDTTSDSYHHDGLFISSNSSSAEANNISIWDNYVHGTSSQGSVCTSSSGSCMTSPIFIEGANDVNVFNNVIAMTMASGDVGTNDGWIFVWSNGNAGGATGDVVVNNTVIGDGGNVGQQSPNCFYLLTLTSATFENNVGTNCPVLVWASGNTFSAFDYNTYQDSSLLWRGSSTTYSSLSAWQTATGAEAHSQATTGSLGLNGNYTPAVGSILIGAATNLTSLSITALGTGAPLTFGVNYACGTGGCVARPSTGAWDAGAYPYSAGGGSSSSISGAGTVSGNASIQ